MADRKAFLLRLDPRLLVSLQRLAADEMRSLNSQIEFLLREALRQRGRISSGEEPEKEDNPGEGKNPGSD